MKKLLIIGLSIGFALTSCKKEQDSGSTTKYSNVSSTNDLKVPSSFNWKPTEVVSLDISSLSADSPGRQTVKVNDSHGNLLLSRTMDVKSGAILQFQLPKGEKQATITHNGITEKIVINGIGANCKGQILQTKHGKAKDHDKDNGHGNDHGHGNGHGHGGKDKCKGDGKDHHGDDHHGGDHHHGDPGTSCDCNGKMQNFKVIYSGSSGVTITVKDKKSPQAFLTLNNVQSGDTLSISNPNSLQLGTETYLIVGYSTYPVHTSCSQDIMGEKYGPFEVIEFTDGQGATCSQNPPPPPPSTSCPCDGRMRNFTVVYNGTTTTTFYLHEKASKQTYPLVYSIPNVHPGDTVVFNGYDKQGRLKAQSFVKINGTTYNIHTSCSQDILGLTYGPITVVAYTDGNGSSCSLTPPPPSCVDSDNDGCCDKDDAFPNDPTKCDVQYVPGKNVYGSYAWEDLWPATGDFDFNDAVIDRNTVLALDHNGEVVEATHKFLLRAAGASYKNGFGFAMPNVTPNEVANVTSTYNQPQNYTSIAANGLENGQSTAVVIVFENWKNIVTYTQNGAYFNTVKNNPNLTAGIGYADTITVTVNFAVPQAISDVLEIDPFLIRDGLRSAEIHLPWFGPTDLADPSLFRTAKDASAYPAPGNNYVTSSNIPWAIETPLSAFDWPIEKVDIVTAYFSFSQWAMTGSPADWYSNGNRDASKIY